MVQPKLKVSFFNNFKSVKILKYIYTLALVAISCHFIPELSWYLGGWAVFYSFILNKLFAVKRKKKKAKGNQLYIKEEIFLKI